MYLLDSSAQFVNKQRESRVDVAAHRKINELFISKLVIAATITRVSALLDDSVPLLCSVVHNL